MFRSQDAIDLGFKEADLLFIKYSCDIFQKFDKDKSNSVEPNEVRKALTYFGIYLNTDQAASAVARFLRDHGQPTPVDELHCKLTFSNFVQLLVVINNYTM